MRYAIPTLAILLFFCSCSDNSHELAVFKAADEGLQQSINTIAAANNVIYKSMGDKLTDRDDSEKAKLWHPKAMQVKMLSDSVVIYLEALRSGIKNRQSGKLNNFEGGELFTRLIKYKEDILAIDPAFNKEFHPNLVLFTNNFDNQGYDPKLFTITFFNDIPSIAAMTMLSKFENNVKIIENNFINLCHNKTGSVMIIDDFPQPLISLDKSYVKGGEEIEINAGIGAFSTVVQPRITIDNIAIPVNPTGVAIYRFKTSEKPGKHLVPVKIKYTKADGTKETAEKIIEYTVVEEK